MTIVAVLLCGVALLSITVTVRVKVGFAATVSAALLATDGSVAEGCNVENAAFPAGICAERSAVAAAVARGNRGFDVIVVATEAEEPTPPCGMCRQVLEEFSPHMLVIAVTRGGREATWTLDELLPQAFTPQSLSRQ